MAGIMTPIAGENKSRTCYFYDSGQFNNASGRPGQALHCSLIASV